MFEICNIVFFMFICYEKVFKILIIWYKFCLCDDEIMYKVDLVWYLFDFLVYKIISILLILKFNIFW